jgi:PIN domain nuclease of toxin-antitoxin system
VRLLLDTHVVIWWMGEARRLTPAEYAAIENPANDIVVSVISLWEIAIKRARGRLQAPDNLRALIAQARGIELDVVGSHAERVATLPDIHRDPFDRMLVAQAIDEGLTLVTRDAMLLRYSVEVFSSG